jgi:uncharacterized membrane protein YkgB
MKIFAAGGTGAIGRPLIAALLAKGHAVVALTRSAEKAQALVEQGIEPGIADLFDADAKWWEYEAQTLIPFISNGPLISWMYPVFGVRGASWFLGISEWITAALLTWGFWNKKAGSLGALISTATFVTTITIIPFMPDGWDACRLPSDERQRCLLNEG